MPKSKEFVDTSDSGSDEDTKDIAQQTSVQMGHRSTGIMSNTSLSQRRKASHSAKSKPKAKKSKKEESTKPKDKAEENDGEKGMYALSHNRNVSVSEFRGKVLVNIREFYEKDGKTLPGKKGISLTREQWDKLKTVIPDIDADIAKMK